MLEIASSSRVTISLGSSFSAIRVYSIPEWGKSARGADAREEEKLGPYRDP